MQMDKGEGKKGKGGAGGDAGLPASTGAVAGGAKDFKDILNATIKMHEHQLSQGGTDAAASSVPRRGERGRAEALPPSAKEKKEKREKKEKKEKKEKDKEKEKDKDKEREREREEEEREKEKKEKREKKEKKEKDKSGDKERDKEKEEKEREKRENKRASVSVKGRVFGGQLKEGLYDKKGNKHPVPPFFEQALTFIEERALETACLFQEAGPKKEIKELIKRVEAKQDIEWSKIKNPHTVCGLVLKYLRDLEEPIFPFYLYKHLIETVSLSTDGMQVNDYALRQLLHALPAPNVIFLKRLFPFLRKIAAHSSKNQMVAESLATFFGPALMRAEGDKSLEALVSHTHEIIFLTAYMINYTPIDLLFSFPEEGNNPRLSNYAETGQILEDRVIPSGPGRDRPRPASNEPSATAVDATEEKRGSEIRRFLAPLPPDRNGLPSPSVPAEDDGVVIEERTEESELPYGPPQVPSGRRETAALRISDYSPSIAPSADRGHIREPSGVTWSPVDSSLKNSLGEDSAVTNYQGSSESTMAWFVWLVRSLPAHTYHQAQTWPNYDESADIYLVNGNELYVYPEHSEFFAVFTSELYRVEDSSRYYFIVSEEGDKLGIIFSTREESAAFARATETGMGYAIPVGGFWAANGKVSAVGTDPKWKSRKKQPKSSLILDEDDTVHKEFEEKEVMSDGWFDAPEHYANKSLDQLRAMPVNPEEREIIEVDARQDARLQNILRLTQLLFSKFPTLETKVRVIALQVSNALGGVYSEDLREIHTAHIQNVKRKLQSNVVPIGNIKFGVLRHRVVLFKYLCDHLHPAIPCTLSKNEDGLLCNLVPVSSNITKYKAVDLMTVPGRLRTEERNRKILWRASVGAAAERHVILPDLQSEPIVFLKKLGEGGFSTVWRCAIGPITCAAKVYKRTDDRIGKDLVRECMIQTHLNHKNILGCLGYEKTASDFLIFFEYMGLGSFWDVLYRRKMANKPFEAKEVAYYATEVARGLHYLHRNKIFHRDIKSANILVDGEDGELFKSVKLCDFNISTFRSDAFSRVGTPQYMAPELLNNTEGRPVDTEKADMWSFGMFIVELLTLDAPYAGLSEGEYVRLISRGIMPPNLPSVTQNKGAELVLKCCNLNPSLRPSARDVVQYLNPLDDSCNS